MAKLGRPKKTFTPEQINQIKALARCHCPDSEIAAAVSIGETTLHSHFGPLLKEQREIGKSNLRAKQFKLAMQGNLGMLIWLGKQLLGQRDGLKLEGAQGLISNVTNNVTISEETIKEMYARLQKLAEEKIQCSLNQPLALSSHLPDLLPH